MCMSGPTQHPVPPAGRRGITAELEEGMVTSDEPGLAHRGEPWNRTENLVLCVKDEKNAYGQFIRFEYLTMAPIDVEGIDKA